MKTNSLLIGFVIAFVLAGCASIHTQTRLDELKMKVEVLRNDFHQHAIKSGGKCTDLSEIQDMLNAWAEKNQLKEIREMLKDVDKSKQEEN